MRLRVLERIDEITWDSCIDEIPDRMALANKLNRVVPASVELHALHSYLVENGFSADAVARFIDEDRRDRKTFHEKRYSGQNIYYGKCPLKLDPAKYQKSNKRYAF